MCMFGIISASPSISNLTASNIHIMKIHRNQHVFTHYNMYNTNTACKKHSRRTDMLRCAQIQWHTQFRWRPTCLCKHENDHIHNADIDRHAYTCINRVTYTIQANSDRRTKSILWQYYWNSAWRLAQNQLKLYSNLFYLPDEPGTIITNVIKWNWPLRKQ